jgi:hypothetical protein
MRHFDAIKYIHEIRSYFQGIIAKNQTGKFKMSSEDTLILKEISFFVTKLKNDLIRAENLINYVVEILFESEHKRYISKEQPLLSGAIPEDLYAYYDEFLYTKKDLTSVIKLMIIESLTQNGIQGYQKKKREILNIFGFQKNIFIQRFRSIRLVKRKTILIKKPEKYNRFQLYTNF